MSKGQAQVNIKLARETLETWDSYIEKETSFRTRAEFVRFAVNREVKGQHDEKSGGSGADPELLNEINQTVKELSGEFGEVKNRIEQLENAVSADPQTENLADTIFTLLPNEKPGSDPWEKELRDRQDELEAVEEGHSDGDIGDVRRRYNAWKATPEALAEATGEPERKVHVAIDKLLTEAAPLVNAENRKNGQTRYWKEV